MHYYLKNVISYNNEDSFDIHNLEHNFPSFSFLSYFMAYLIQAPWKEKEKENKEDGKVSIPGEIWLQSCLEMHISETQWKEFNEISKIYMIEFNSTLIKSASTKIAMIFLLMIKKGSPKNKILRNMEYLTWTKKRSVSTVWIMENQLLQR